MASKDRLAVLSAMIDQGVIPVFYHPDVEVCMLRKARRAARSTE